MVDVTILQRLYAAFPKALLNHNLEFIVDLKANTYFLLADCETEEDVIAKLLEWLSRAAFKTEPYGSRTANKKFHAYHLDGINQFCSASFTEDDMEEDVIARIDGEAFFRSLSETDQKILLLRNMGKSMQKVADLVGLKTHSAVYKRIQRIGKTYENWADEDLKKRRQ